MTIIQLLMWADKAWKHNDLSMWNALMSRAADLYEGEGLGYGDAVYELW